MTNLSSALEQLARLFERLKIPYAVMGGIAVRVYGIPRPTHDVDFTAALPRERLAEFFHAVADLGFTVPEQYTRGWVDRVAGMPLVKVRLYLDEENIDIDVFLAESKYQREILARCRAHTVDGISVSFVSPEDLILLKLLAHRPRDIADVGDVLFTQGQLDEDYLRRWAKEIGVLNALEEVLENN